MDKIIMKNSLELKEKYNSIYKDGAKNFFALGNGLREASSIVQSYNWTNKEVLDIGCGEGAMASMICEAGASRVVGVDYSVEAINNAKAKFDLPNLIFLNSDYRQVQEKFDIITMQGVMEHFDDPWGELKNIINNLLSHEGIVITSSPSFLNPRGYVWMTLAKLFNVPMSLTDLHFICPFDMINFCKSNNYKLQYESIHQDWGCGKHMLKDLHKRLTNALRDAKMDNSNVDDLLTWMSQASRFFTQNNESGAIVIYRITK